MYITIRFVTNGSVVQISRLCRIDENQFGQPVTDDMHKLCSEPIAHEAGRAERSVRNAHRT